MSVYLTKRGLVKQVFVIVTVVILYILGVLLIVDYFPHWKSSMNLINMILVLLIILEEFAICIYLKGQPSSCLIAPTPNTLTIH